jgi:predicted XRE-type DNA-binding protein
MKRDVEELTKTLGVTEQRATEAVIKARLIAAVDRAMKAQRLTHLQVAERAGLPRSAVTGILSGSLQKITIDRILRMVEAVGLIAEVRVRRAA